MVNSDRCRLKEAMKAVMGGLFLALTSLSNRQSAARPQLKHPHPEPTTSKPQNRVPLKGSLRGFYMRSTMIGFYIRSLFNQNWSEKSGRRRCFEGSVLVVHLLKVLLFLAVWGWGWV